MYSVELNYDDITLIKGAAMATTREANLRFDKEVDKVAYTNACAQVVTRLNEGRLTQDDVMLICRMLEKVRELLTRDRQLTREAIELGREKCLQLQEKLTDKTHAQIILAS